MPAALVSVRFLGVRGPAASEDTATVTRVPDEFREPSHMLKTIDESNPVLAENSTRQSQCREDVVAGRALRARNSVTKCALLAPVIARRFRNGPLISQHFHWPVTPAPQPAHGLR